MKSKHASFGARLRNGDALMGTFLKTPSSIMAEVLAHSDLDVVAIDAEHAPFGRLEMDACISALRAADMPCLVRLSSDSPTDIRNALDCGATGIVVPHVTTAEQAAAIVKAAHFGDGGRGFAGSPRAAEYTRKTMADHMQESREQTTVVVQIEDIAALKNVAQISAVDGVDCIFVGRVDLAVGLQKAVSDDELIATVQDICAAGQAADMSVGMFTPNLDELSDWQKRGANLFLLSSDQSIVLAGANDLAQTIR